MSKLFWRLNRFILKRPLVWQTVLLFLISFFIPLIFFPLTYLIDEVFGKSNAGPTKDNLSKAFIFSVVIGPLVETLLNQYFVFKVMQDFKSTRNKYGIYILISALLFGLLHNYSLRYIVFAFAVGLSLAYTYYLYHKEPTKAFWITTLVHSLRNLTSTIIIHLTE